MTPQIQSKRQLTTFIKTNIPRTPRATKNPPVSKQHPPVRPPVQAKLFVAHMLDIRSQTPQFLLIAFNGIKWIQITLDLETLNPWPSKENKEKQMLSIQLSQLST